MSELLYGAFLFIESHVTIGLKKDILYSCTTKIQEKKKMNTVHKNIQTKLTKGLLDLIILQLLDTQPMHGYELILTIRKSYGVSFGASTIYPLLNTMEKKTFVKCQWNMNGDRPKKIYTLTSEGKSLLSYTTGSLRSICRLIETNNGQSADENLQFNVGQNSKTKERYVESKSF